MKDELTALAESLDSKARAKIVDPVIAAITALLARRFRKQAGLVAAGMSISHGQDLKTAARLDALLEQAEDGGAGLVADELGLSDLEAPDLTRQGTDILADLDRTSAREVRSIIKDGTLKGLSREEIQAQIEAAFNGWADARANASAVHEASTALHDGMLAAARASGETLVKEWLTDSDPCPTCEDNAGEQIGLDEPFASGEMAPPQHLNCRCSMRVFAASEASEE
jgi:hypothetical protein